MAVLFVHGAGGYDDDRPLHAALADGLTEPIRMPRFPDDDMAHATWSGLVREHLHPEVVTVVGHSFGGSVALKLLTEADLGIVRLVLLAAPDWGPDGWDVDDYALASDAERRLPPGVKVELHHCADDDVVPASHLDLLAARLPGAVVTRHERGGHQFEGAAIAAVVSSLRGDAT